jgi:hypothetical protein
MHQFELRVPSGLREEGIQMLLSNTEEQDPTK